jgi:hypothetical protein
MSSKSIDLGLGSFDDIKPSSRQPRTSVERREENDRVDTISRDHGFSKPSAPAPTPRRQRNTNPGEPMHQISIKGPVRVMERLMAYCDSERLPYWEAIERLMDKAEVPGR